MTRLVSDVIFCQTYDPNVFSKYRNVFKHLLIIPCHRVIRKDGKLGGFSSYGGIKLKKKLLDLENSH